MGLGQEELEPERKDLMDPRRRLLEEEVRIEIAGRTVSMTFEQCKILSHIDDPTEKVMIAQAPAGTGKTYILTIYLTILFQKTKGVILVTAPTTLAVQIIEKVLDNEQLKTEI